MQLVCSLSSFSLKWLLAVLLASSSEQQYHDRVAKIRSMWKKVFTPPWHFSYFVALQPGIKFDFWGGCIIWFTQHAYHFEDTKYFWGVKQTRNKTKKQNLSVHNYSPPQSQNFVEPPFAAITASSLLGYVSISLAHLATEIFVHSSRQNYSSSFKLNWIPLVYSNL
jgi:hypothetical protein